MGDNWRKMAHDAETDALFEEYFLHAGPSRVESQRWIFTFGFGHTHPVTGERLANCYVAIEGDVNTSREVMARHFGNKWSMQYPSEEKAGVQKYGLERIDLPN